MGSFATVTPGNMELTPMRVNFKGTDLGGTLSSVKVSTKFDKANIMADQFGKTVLDRRVSGLEIAVETEITEIALKQNWKHVFPPSKTVGSNPYSQYFQSAIGESDLADAGVLLLHPMSRADGDLSGDFKFWKACADGVSEPTFNAEKQVVMKVKWNILPDTGVVPARFMVYGDPTIGLVAASAGSPAPTGTGNGTVTSVSVANGVTLTETITLTRVGTGAASADVWFVSGSISGPLGEFTLAAANLSTHNFTSAYINFTITQGTVQFVTGDTFTIATTAANYA